MLTLATSIFALAIAPAPLPCSYDREAILALDFVAFDQTEGSGWRQLYEDECFVEAAEALSDWRQNHGAQLSPDDAREAMMLRILAWHEAQMWAFAGRDSDALVVFESDAVMRNDEGGEAWNIYVEGTRAFLRRDRATLKAAIEGLSALPRPAGWGNAVDLEGRPIVVPWPQNLDVLEGFERCWDEPYSVAYLCRETAQSES